MENIIFGWRNYADLGTITGGSWLAALPVTNLQDRQIQLIARSTDATITSTTFDIDFGATYNIDALALIFHNLSVDATVQWLGNTTNSFTTPAYTGAVDLVWPIGMIPQNLLNWDSANFWTGCMSAAERASWQTPFIHRTPTTQALRYWRCKITDTGNTAGSVYMGRLFVCTTWQTEINYSYGAGMGRIDTSTSVETLSGAEYFQQRPTRRTFDADLNWLTSDEAYTRADDLYHYCGITQEVLIIPDGTDQANGPRRNYLATMRSLSPITQVINTDTFTMKISVKEIL